MNQSIQKSSNVAQLSHASFTNAQQATDALRHAMENYILVSPATAIAEIPEGCAVVLSQVLVDLSSRKNDDGKLVYTSGDVYPVDGGKVALSKGVLLRIASALGISWIVSQRMDDGRNPHYCHWRVEGVYRTFDGMFPRVQGNKQMDLRDGSKQTVGKSEKQLLMMRQFIMEHAETKAIERAIGNLVNRSYPADALKKPFVVARMMFTGRSEDPRLRQMFAEKIADSFLGGQQALYGGGGAAMPALQAGAPAQQPAFLPAPPLDMVDDSGEYDLDTGEVRQPERKVEQKSSARSDTQTGARAQGWVIPGGNSKGTPLADASDRDLKYWADRLAKELNEGNSRDPDRDNDLMQAMRAEMRRREGGEPAGDKF